MVEQLIAMILPAAFAVLPAPMASQEATAFLLAVGLQASRFLTRRKTTASAVRGFWQLEPRHVMHVLQHPQARGPVVEACRALRYSVLMMERDEVSAALEHNDIFGAVIARCLLWTYAGTLPQSDQAAAAWRMYVDLWALRGVSANAPSREWAGLYEEAWARVSALPRRT